MELLRPKIISVRTNGPFQAAFEVAKTESYDLTENDIVFQKTIETFYISTPVTPFQAKIPNIGPITTEIIERYHEFQELINHCINNAESINSKLRDFLLTIKGRKETKEEIIAMDFMGLRGIFSDFLHSYTEIKRVENFNSKPKRKKITTDFFSYISDRNIYTHGILKLRRPDETFVIQFIENKKVKRYAELNKDTLISNLHFSNYLSKIIKETNSFYNNVQTIG